MTPGDTEQEVLAEQVRLLYSNAPLAYRLSLLNAILVYAVLASHVKQEPLLAWLVTVLGITVLRYLIVAAYWRSATAGTAARTWAARLRIGALLAALAWGCLIIVPGIGAPIWIQSFSAFVIAGMSTAALISLSALPSISVPHIVLILLPLPVTLALHGDPPRLAMALMATFYLFLLVRLVYRVHDIIVTGIRLRLQNEEMFRIFAKASRSPPA